MSHHVARTMADGQSCRGHAVVGRVACATGRVVRHDVPLIAIAATLALALLLLLSGCLRLTGPGPGLRELQTQVARQVLDDAKAAFVRADYADAIPLLRRFVRTQPPSSLSLEARWWLARSYQGSGNLTSAARHFRLLAGAHGPNPYRAEALVRAAHLEELTGTSTTDDPVHGMFVPLVSRPAPYDPVSRIEDVDIEGAIVLLDVPCGRDGKAFRTGQPLSSRAVDNVIRRLHHRGAAVYLGVTLQCVGHAAEARRGMLDPWRDWDYTPSSGRHAGATSGALRRASGYSLWFEGYRRFVVEWLSELRDLPLTGLIFRSEASSGMHAGFNPLALQAFEREFGVTFDPVRVLNNYGPISVAASDADAHLPDVFWKWAGWKARERSRILRDMVTALRVRLPRLRFGLEVQSQSVVDPLRGLLHFAEDWAEASRGPFDVFLTTLHGAGPVRPRAASRGTTAVRACSVRCTKRWARSLFHMVQSVGKADTVWAIVPRPASETSGESMMLPSGVRRLYDDRVVP